MSESKALALFLHPTLSEVRVPLGDLSEDTLLDAMQAHLRRIAEDRELLRNYLNGRLTITADVLSFPTPPASQESALLSAGDATGPHSPGLDRDSLRPIVSELGTGADRVLFSGASMDSEADAVETQPPTAEVVA